MLLYVIQQARTVLTAGNPAYTVAALVLSLASIIVGLLWTTPSFTTWRQLRNLRRVKPKKKNMKDQYDEKYAIPEETPTDGPVTIKAIFIHPIKSCAPVEVDKAVVTKAGLLYDRCFAFAVDAEDKKSDEKKTTLQFISQRTKPKMSLIHTELWLPRESSDSKDPLVHAGGALRITFPDPEPPSLMRRLQACVEQLHWNATPRYAFVVPLTPTIRYLRESDLQPRSFTIHSREAHGVDMGRVSAVAGAVPRLKALLGYPERRTLTLLRCTPDTLTQTDCNFAPLARIGSRSVHGYTDQQPVNINSVASVHAVSRLLPPENRPLDALRFRANLWIAGAGAYDEETWKRCRVRRRKEGGRSGKPPPTTTTTTTLSVVCRTSRCTMPSVDPESGTFSAERPAEGKKKGRPQPTTALVRHRMVESGNGSALGYLGMHAVPEDRDLDAAREGLGKLEIFVGDEIEVLERGEHLYGSTEDSY